MRRAPARPPRPIVTALTLALLAVACSDDPQDAVGGQLPSDWSTEVVDDDREGDFVFSHRDDAALWHMGDDPDDVSDATEGTPWAGFWIPQLADATSDRDNVRALAVVNDDEGVVSWQVNVGATSDDATSDPDELAAAWGDHFRSQELDVEVETTAQWNERTIAQVEFRVPDGVFDGEERYVRQWFVLDEANQRLWSFVCDGPADAAASAEVCRTALDGFRPSDHPAGVDT